MQLNLPKYKLSIKTKEEKSYVFDIIRKKYIVLTPEEWVRQNFLHYLLEEKQFPKGLTTVEQRLKFHGMDRRADIATYTNAGKILVVTECKAPKIKITQKTFDQIARYNMVLKAKYLLVTNGLSHYCCRYTADDEYTFLKEIPNYKSIQHEL
ncbi:MAG: type I restriction enzyme HsdR N-terminal domain-containing protein [Bacteroidota bacterium]|nr:type I restriction enzyme HsdR N-terminal domain-containing protein [Bacteroidota bacterium]